MKKLILSIILLVICGCNQKETVLEYQKIMQEHEYQIIDVRTKEEFETTHLKEAINIPYNEINETIEIDKNKYLLVYCQSGSRSKIAKEALQKLGYKVYDLGAYAKINLPKEE